jgi:hypothetical protein
MGMERENLADSGEHAVNSFRPETARFLGISGHGWMAGDRFNK